MCNPSRARNTLEEPPLDSRGLFCGFPIELLDLTLEFLAPTKDHFLFMDDCPSRTSSWEWGSSDGYAKRLYELPHAYLETCLWSSLYIDCVERHWEDFLEDPSRHGVYQLGHLCSMLPGPAVVR